MWKFATQEQLLRLGRAVAFAALTVGVSVGAWAQTPSSWRVFKADDGLRESFVAAVTLNPRSKIWLTHRDVDAATWLDGFSIKQIPAPLGGNFRIHESPSGQIWAVHPEGIQEYHDGQWHVFRIPEVIAEFRAQLVRTVREISLVPAERDNVLILLSDRLLKFDISASRATVLREASQTGLERFWDMIPARDGGIWITGGRGAAKLPPSIRRISPETEWKEHLVPAAVAARDITRPFEGDRNDLVVIASASTNGQRTVLLLEGGEWTAQPFPAEAVRQCWRDVDGGFWGLTVSSLLRFEGDRREVVQREGIVSGRYYDVAVGTNGVFWLATSEGLLRYAPSTWRTPRSMPAVDGMVHGTCDLRRDRTWLATSDELMVLQGGQLKRFTLPEPMEAAAPLPRPFAVLADGSVALEIGGRLRVLNPASGGFASVPHPANRKVRLLGTLRDGRLAVQAAAADGAESRIEAFDGKTFQATAAPAPGREFGGDWFFLHAAQNGDLWVGGAAGVACFHDRQWQTHTVENGYQAGAAFCALELGEGRIWIGGREGITQYDGRAWTTIGPRFDRVSALRQGRDGAIWAATGNGLYRQHGDSWVANSLEEGLPSASVSSVFEDQSGGLWAVTTAGLSRYHPEGDPDPPRVSVAAPRSARGLPTDNAYTFQFSARDKWRYTPVDRLLYSWRLDEDAWSVFGPQTSATLPEVPAGDHRFEVRALDRNWNTSPVIASFPFEVMVPWFKEPRIVGVTLLGLLVALFFAALAFNRHLQLKRSYAEVERIVAQRTRELELANQELLHSQKMKALGTLAAGIAHDFNSILSIIKGSVQIIEANLENRDKIRTRVGRIKTMVDQGASIVKAMLGYSRAEKQTTDLDLGSVVQETLHLMGDKFLHELKVSFEPATNLPPVRGSKELIQQILLNLIFNAAEAMEGKGDLVLRTGAMDAPPKQLVLHPATPGRCVCVSVNDTGSGIPPEIQSRVFEPFFTTKAMSTQPGTGLGLSMVYEFAREMGYGIGLESELGKGTTFTIFIPAAEPSEPATVPVADG